ncbi:GNAT family N-acetyltransferase [Rothia sp. P13129]|uniref:GNAT family N-acetyltransferase n=1 Tax=Rothia sp. P13129 TaxID=3402664 RepID=UPI003AC2E871
MSEKNRHFTVREATEADYAGAIEALTNAFEHDPVMSHAMGGTHQGAKIRELFEFQIRNTYASKGKIDIAVDENDTILGAALWLSPEGQKGNLLADLRALPQYTKLLGRSLFSAVITEIKLLRARPAFDHWYLYTIGVHESARSCGVGSALLDYRLARTGRCGSYLEASTYRSASLYRRHGFTELGAFKGGKPAVGMWHPAPVSLIDEHLPTSSTK